MKANARTLAKAAGKANCYTSSDPSNSNYNFNSNKVKFFAPNSMFVAFGDSWTS